jgi:hypothetical protein
MLHSAFQRRDQLSEEDFVLQVFRQYNAQQLCQSERVLRCSFSLERYRLAHADAGACAGPIHARAEHHVPRSRHPLSGLLDLGSTEHTPLPHFR